MYSIGKVLILLFVLFLFLTESDVRHQGRCRTITAPKGERPKEIKRR